ncbi:hypothetical protein ACPPVO_22120 [Dactylosporangium sp. McL0621]|uniref:hypothetical protein n=1 Tax=Dactylosporangium sp. McL0621 TaxID=3415678 RepID=UPI003CF6347B
MDEFNRPAQADDGAVRLPPSEDEVEAWFAAGGGRGCRTREVRAGGAGLSGGVAVASSGLRIVDAYLLDIRD